MRSIVFAMVPLLIAVESAAAEDWPTRPVTMVIPASAGGTGDVFGRILAPRLSENLNRPVIVEDVGGAGGLVATSRVARAAPDGYQFLFGNIGTHAFNQTLYKTPLYNAATDFAPVLLIAEIPAVLITRNDLPANNLTEFIAYAKAHDANMRYGSSGVGSPPHLACARFNAAIGVNVTHIPYRGAPLAVQDLIAGRIDYMCVGPAVASPQIESKTVKAIAILKKSRSLVLPSVASAQEQGLADFEVDAWDAFFFPRGTPEAIVRKLHDATVAAMELSDVQNRLKEAGAAVVAPERRSSDYLQKFVESEIGKWASVIKSQGLGSE